MSDFSNLLTELSSPQDRAAYEQYADAIAQLVNFAKEQKNKIDSTIKEKSQTSIRKKIVAFLLPKIKDKNRSELNHLRAEYYYWDKAINRPEEFIRNNKRKEKTFIELSAGAKQYAVLKKIVEEATKAGETNPNKVIETFNTFKQNIQDYPLIYTSTQHCLALISPNQKVRADNWNEIIQNAETIRNNKEEKIEFSDIKHVSLTKFFKGRFCDKYSEVVDILSKCQINREAGSLPPEWISLVPREQLAAKTKEISQILQEFSKRSFSDKDVPEYLLDSEIKNLSNQLSKALNTTIEASFLGNGAIGKAIKLVTNKDKALVLKINHSNPKYGLDKGHGVQIEAARGMFISSNNDRNKYAKTYFARFGDVNATDAFMISRFVEQEDNANNTLHQQRLSDQQIIEQEELSQVRNFDNHENNVVGSVCIDLGGCYIPEYMRDPKCYKIFKTLYKSLKRKDGPQLINRVVNSCEKNPVLRNKLKTVKVALEKALQNTPDIDVFGKIYDYGFRPECLETLGITNQVDIFDALDRARNKETIDYIISSRGGIKKTAQMLEEKGGQEGKHISLQNAQYLMDRNIPVTSIAPSILVYDMDEFKKMVSTQNQSNNSSRSSNAASETPLKQNEALQSSSEHPFKGYIKQLRGLAPLAKPQPSPSVNKENALTLKLYQTKKNDFTK